MSPFQCPSLFSILSFLEYEHGVFHPYGGCARVCERMAEIATEMGVEIHFEEEVKAIRFDGRKFAAVETGRRQYAGDALVINSDFAATMQKLVPNSLRKKWSDQQLEKKKYSCSTFMLYLGIEGRYDDLPHHSIHIARDYVRNLKQIEQDFVLPDEPSFYVQNPAVTDDSLAPEGKSGLYVLVPVPNLQKGSVVWDNETRRRYRDLTLERMKEIGLHDLKDRIVYEKIFSPADWRDSMSVYAGATFNLAHGLDQMLHRRPHNAFEELEDVYLVGGGTHPGSGLPVIFESSRITCKELLPKMSLPIDFIEHPPQRPIGRVQRETAEPALAFSVEEK